MLRGENMPQDTALISLESLLDNLKTVLKFYNLFDIWV